MRDKLKKSLFVLLNFVSGFAIFLILPGALAIALNTTHSAGNNPDGRFVSPIGWFILAGLLLFLISLWIINVQYARGGREKRRFLFILILAFLLGAVLAAILHHFCF